MESTSVRVKLMMCALDIGAVRAVIADVEGLLCSSSEKTNKPLLCM